MKNKLVFLAMALISGGALAQSSVSGAAIQTPILDSYTAGMLECQCSTDHPDGHGVPEYVRKSDEMRAKAFEASPPAPKTAVTAQPQSMATNQAASGKNNGSRPSHPPPRAR